jgi:hypothetical protein
MGNRAPRWLSRMGGACGAALTTGPAASRSRRSTTACSLASHAIAARPAGRRRRVSRGHTTDDGIVRIRKLKERIIEAGKQTGETTLSSYEKALKAIAGAVERGPGTSDIDWISNLATTQAKFIRDVTQAWTSAARDMLK